MIIYSEITGKEYDSVNECLDDELAYKKAEKERVELEEKAYNEAIEACDRYLKLMGVDINADELIDDNDEDDYEEEIFEFTIDEDADDDILLELIKYILA